MRKIIAMAAMLALTLGLLSACGTKSVNLVGTWDGVLYGVETELTFAENGGFTMKTGDTVLGRGTWALSGSALTLTYDTDGEDEEAEAIVGTSSVSVSTVDSVDVLTITSGTGAAMSFTRRGEAK